MDKKQELKRLLIVTSRYPPREGFPMNVFVKNQTDDLKKYFKRVVVISTTPYIPRSIAKFMQPRRVHESLVRDYKYENVEVYYTRDIILPFESSKKKWGDKALTKAIKILDYINFKPDIIHGHFTWPSGYVAVKLSKKYGVPSIVTIHENREWFLSEYHSENKSIYWTWKNATALIRVNKVDVPLLRKYNRNVYTIPNGFTSDRLPLIPQKDARKTLGLSTNIKMLFGLGNLIERKGFHYLLDAMYIIAKKRDDVMCFIGGDGPMRSKLLKKIERLNLEKFIKILGYVPDNQLKYWMNAADLFVLPSLSESFGIAQLEAMACGKPVVATYNGGSEELITSKDYGFLCPPKDPECLAEKILIALEKEWDREKIRKYAEQFTWDSIAEKILDVYLSVMQIRDKQSNNSSIKNTEQTI